jgi:hypothetical protein
MRVYVPVGGNIQITVRAELVRLRCVKSQYNKCNNCVLIGDALCEAMNCFPDLRPDGIRVHFEKIEEK